MSGPTTAIFVGDPIAVLVSAAAIRAAQAVREGYENAAALKTEHDAQRDQYRAQLKDASLKGVAAMQQAVKDADAEFARMIELAKRYGADARMTGSRPAPPILQDETQMAAYVQSMQMLLRDLRNILLTESAMLMDDAEPGLILDSVIAQTTSPRQLDAVQRLLARIAHLGEYPKQITSIAQEISGQPSLDGERAKLLLSELRLQIQQHAEDVRKQSVQEATALVLEQSLKDLGYQVEDVADTLFVDGGVVHFRKPGWNNYLVRMRVDPKNASTNFNVIKAVESETNERSVLDHLAEDRWCTEFPALLKALDARGLHLNVTRRLEAGELPVQMVLKDKLPKFTDQEQSTKSDKLKSLNIK